MKNIINVEGGKNYRKPRNFLTRNTEKAMYKYFNIIRNETMELQRTQYYDLMYVKTKELGYKINHVIKNIGVDEYKGYTIGEV